jgi:hypothetical protein
MVPTLEVNRDVEQRQTATELATRQPGFHGRARPTPGRTPITSVDEVSRPGTFESQELHGFLTDLYGSRRSDAAWLPHRCRFDPTG